MRSLLSQLPVPHYETLRRLCVHLRVIHDHNTSTRMTARNLGIVFGRAYLFCHAYLPLTVHSYHHAFQRASDGTH